MNLTKFADILQRALLAPSLGHGRMIETYLASVCFVYGTLILFYPDTVNLSMATKDLPDYLNRLVIIPFYLKAGFSGYGILSNIKNWRYSYTCRMIGAILGVLLFVWYATKLVFVGAANTMVFAFLIVSIFCCARVMILASMGLPIPGARGRL